MHYRDAWLDIESAAERVQVSEAAVWACINAGLLHSVEGLVTGPDGSSESKRMVPIADLDVAFPGDRMPWRQYVRIMNLMHGGSIEEYKRDRREAALEAGIELDDDD